MLGVYFRTDHIRCGVYSAKTNVPFRAGKIAVERAMRQVFDESPALCLVFFSERYASPELIDGINQVISPDIVVGCSTNGEIATGYRRESLVAIVLSTDYMRFGMAAYPNEDLATNSKSFYKDFYDAAYFDLQNRLLNTPSKIALPDKPTDITPDFGMIFLPGTDIESEPKANEVINNLRSYLGNLPLIGGTIGDDCQYEKGYAICKDQFLEDSTILILAKSDLQFSMAQTHGYYIKKEFSVDKAYRNNLVLLDNRPASEIYFESINQPIVEISDLRDEICAINPLGLYDEKTKEMQFLFPMSRGKGARELTVSQIIPEGIKIYLAEAEMEKSRKASLDSIKTAYTNGGIKDPRVGLMFSCVGRSTFYFDRALAEVEEIKNRFKYTDIGGAYLNGTICGQNSWVSEGTTSTLLIGNDIIERKKEEKQV